MAFFKGYVPTKEKSCTMKFKNAKPGELMTYEQVKKMPEYAGILDDDSVLLDIDDQPQSELMLEIVKAKHLPCRVYKTTHGMHFLFKNKDRQYKTCKNKCNLACGITQVDVKAGHRNSYEVLKYNGKERPVLYDAENYAEAPKWLMPMKFTPDFQNMGDGDGRNTALFTYILNLQSSGLNVEECRECIRIINDYILPESMDEEEIEKILRDESFQKEMFFQGKTFLFDKFGTYLRSTRHVVKIDGQLAIYKDGVYMIGDRYVAAEMIKIISGLNRAKRQDVLDWLKLNIEDDVQQTDARYIAFKNGIYDTDTDELLDFSPEFIITNKINHDYIPNAYSEIADKTLNKLACGDHDIRKLLEEVIGYTFFRKNELRKAFILVGDKANGKSTYLDMIGTLLGDNNTTALDLAELGNRFKTAEIAGKLACIGDDIGDEFIPNPSVFKKLVSGDRMNAERKGCDPFDFKNYAKLLFSANDIPRIKDKTGAVIDRLVIVPFNATFSRSDPDFDPFIKYKLREEAVMEYLIQIGIDGLIRVLDNEQFTIPEKVKNELKTYEEYNNPVLLFLDNQEIDEGEITKIVYTRYKIFCNENGFITMSHIEFNKQVKKYCGMNIAARRINGKVCKVFTEG